MSLWGSRPTTRALSSRPSTRTTVASVTCWMTCPLVTTLPAVSMSRPEAVASSPSAATSMRTTDGPSALAAAANARERARASPGVEVGGERVPPATDPSRTGTRIAAIATKPTASR
jgi:hypothetical protein